MFIPFIEKIDFGHQKNWPGIIRLVVGIENYICNE